MAERHDGRRWERVKFENFPLVARKAFPEKGRRVWIFGGRYFSITSGAWAGVSYEGRYKFYTPFLHEEAEEAVERIVNGLWNFREVHEKANIINAKGMKMQVKREYFCLEPAEGEPQHWARFIGGYYKTTLKGYGRDRNYNERVSGDDVEVVCHTSNHCRSGRYGSFASLVIAPHPIEVESVGEP